MTQSEVFIPSKKQRKVLKWWKDTPVADKDGIIADGAIRSGKTHSMSFSFIIWAMNTYNDENFAMCGKTINALRRNVIIPLKKMLLRHGYDVYEKRHENLITISKGDVENFFYMFSGKDESSQDVIQGITLAGVFFDEVALMPESFVNQATGRCSIDGSKLWFNCNPEGPYHWFKTGWVDKHIEKNLLYLHFTMEDNPSLTDRIKERYRSMYVGVFFKRYILGMWEKAEGLIYPMYQDALTDVNKERDVEQYVVSIDYGTQNPFAALLWAKYRNDPTWYAVKGYYYNGRETGVQKTDYEYGEDMDKFVNPALMKIKTEDQRYPVRIKVIVDPSAASFIALLRKKSWCKVLPANNEVIDGIRDTATAIQLGLIKIDNSITEWKMEASGYTWDEKVTDKPVKERDHYMDSTRYFIRTMRITKTKSDYIPLTQRRGDGNYVFL